MKIKRVLPNNRKRVFVVESSTGVFEFCYAQLRFKPTENNRVVSVAVDREAASEAFTYRLESGAEDTVLLDQVLYANNDPEIMRRHLLFELSCKAQSILTESRVTKRSLARRLGVAPTQLYRLLDQTFFGKTIDQMVKLMCVLGHEVKISTKSAA